MTGPGEPQDELDRLLELWQAARRWRDQLTQGSPEWHAAEQQVHEAHAAYRARLAEIELRDPTREADEGNEGSV